MTLFEITVLFLIVGFRVDAINPACFLSTNSGPDQGCERVAFTFNYLKARCEGFKYKKCGESVGENNFKTKEDCESACRTPVLQVMNPKCFVQHVPDYENGCKSTEYYFSSRTRSCVPEIFRGCGMYKSENHFNTLKHCQEYCESPMKRLTACLMDKDYGDCLGNQTKFYYDAAIGDCARFSFSGCGGNLNVHENLTSCQQACRMASE